ncbi:MAG: metal ABC transporter permease [bacterium]|nr:metal ABC transporter permease [bacterium]
MTDIFIQSLIICIVLVWIHSYFGFEIVKRGIIFADIAIAQFVAVGLAFCTTFLNLPNITTYLCSFFFGLIAALIISFASNAPKNFLEAFIGTLYALGFSLTIIILSKNPHGIENIIEFTTNDILFVTREQIFHSIIFYLIIGFLIHFFNNLHNVEELKNILFFTFFALVVSTSVKLVGVLVVFSLLVSPTFVACVFKKDLLFAVIYGTTTCLLSIIISFLLDLPTGFTIVFINSVLAASIFIIQIKNITSIKN